MGRRLQPFALAVSLTMLVLTYAFARNVAIGDLLDDAPGDLLGSAAWISFVIMTAGWWTCDRRLLRGGILIAASVWAGVSTVLILDIGWLAVSTLLSFCWLIAAGGAWLLESESAEDR